MFNYYAPSGPQPPAGGYYPPPQWYPQPPPPPQPYQDPQYPPQGPPPPQYPQYPPYPHRHHHPHHQQHHHHHHQQHHHRHHQHHPHHPHHPNHHHQPSLGYPPPAPTPQNSSALQPPLQPLRPHHRSWSGSPRLPPAESQSFGRGAPSSYQFKYSACTGRRKALLIGINYLGQPNQLKGCINDVQEMSIFLHREYNYRREDMVILTDDQANPMSIPTKANMLRAMHWLVNGAQPHDSLFLHFSGHGGRTPDLDGDEDDGMDDVIYPVDFRNTGHIVDDEMHDIMVRPLLAGVRLTAIFDSCHSGTALDLPYIYSTQGILKEPNLAKDTAQGLFSALISYEKGDISEVASTAMGLFKKVTIGNTAREKTVRTKTSPADVVMFSGSKDTQTSADTFQDGESRGALSWSFIKSLRQQREQSYLQLLNNIRAELEGRYSQKPQLSSSHPLDVHLLFVM